MNSRHENVKMSPMHKEICTEISERTSFVVCKSYFPRNNSILSLI
jgi:hypothetical protein